MGKEGKATSHTAEKKAAPGPGQYNPKDSLDPLGNYFVGKFRSTQT